MARVTLVDDPNTPPDRPQLRTSVVVPTYRRPASLSACIGALRSQVLSPAEIIIVVRPDDLETLNLLADFKREIRVVHVQGPGAVAAVRAGCNAATGKILAITDDDAVPHADWIRRIELHFDGDPALGLLGGRDFVHVDGVVARGDRRTVGRVLWWGRWVGNHHLDSSRQAVQYVKGVNMALRKSAYQDFGEHLRGAGAQVAWEIDLSGAVRRTGWRVEFDPDLNVDHYPATRHDDDGRRHRSRQAQQNEVFNTLYAVLRHAPALHWLTIVPYQLLLGERRAPGLILAIAKRQTSSLTLSFAFWRLRAVLAALLHRRLRAAPSSGTTTRSGSTIGSP